MSAKKIGYPLIGIGVFIIFIMLIVDSIGLGSGGIQAAQLLGIEVGVFVIFLGYFFLVTSSEKTNVLEWRDQLSRFFSSPVVAVLIGVLAAYFVFSIVPMLLNSDLRFQYFSRYLPDKYPIGLDLQTLLNHVKTWFEIKTPYPGGIFQFYPPLTYAFFSPLTMLDYRTAYLVMILVTLISYVVLTLLIPVRMHFSFSSQVSLHRICLVFHCCPVEGFSSHIYFDVHQGLERLEDKYQKICGNWLVQCRTSIYLGISCLH